MKQMQHTENFQKALKENFRITTKIKWSFLIGFELCVLLLFCVFKWDIFAHMWELDVFIPDYDYVNHYIDRPGGLLLWVANWVMEISYYPLVGILLFLFMMTDVLFMMWRTGNMKPFAGLFLLAACMVLFISRLDYSIYTLRTPGFLFLLPLGLLTALVMLWCYQRITRYRLFYVALSIIVGYFLIGFYALLGGLMIMLWACKHHEIRIKIVFVTLITMVLVPLVYYMLLERMNIRYIYFVDLPFIDFVSNPILWIPMIGAFGVVVWLILTDPLSKWSLRTEICLYMVSIGLMFGCTYWDENFHALMKMERAVEVSDWDKVLQVAREHERPTRSMVMYRNVALLHKGCIADSMFTYPDASEPLATSEELQSTLINGAAVYFYFGQINYCARLAMEMSVLYGMNIRNAKYLTKAAIYNREHNLAYKYLRAIHEKPFTRTWTNKYGSYLIEKNVLKTDSEYGVIDKLRNYEQIRFIDSDVTELNLIDHFAQLEGGTLQTLELSMLSIMLTCQSTQCINCHAFQNYRTDRMQFHIRAYKGCTVIANDGNIEKVNIKTDSLILNGVYPAWHPTEALIAYSVNYTRQCFQNENIQKIEVIDSKSDLVLYDVNRRQMTVIQNDTNVLETFPTWSPDGRWLLFSMGQYGTFHIWHRSSDLYLTDLSTRETRKLENVNSGDIESITRGRPMADGLCSVRVATTVPTLLILIEKGRRIAHSLFRNVIPIII